MTSLVVQTAFLGDVVLTTPLLEALATQHGPVDVVTTPAAAGLLETHPAVRRVIPYDKHGTDRGFGGLRRLASRLRAERYAEAYLPHRSLRSAALARLAGIPRRIGFADGWRRLYTEARPRPTSGHEIDRLLALARDSATPGRRPSLRLTEEDTAAAASLLVGGGIAPGAPFAGLAPGAIWGTKRWPRYEELARRLVAQLAVVVVGSRDDASLGEAIVAAAGAGGDGRHPVVNACGRLTLRQTAALVARAAVLVTNDSAPLHLAQAVGTRTVAVFGPTVPAFGFGPRGLEDRVVQVALHCRPCSPHGPAACPLGHHRCMTELSVEQVLHTIEETGALHRRD